MKKRWTSILLTVAMVVSLLPAMAPPARAVSVVYVNSESDLGISAYAGYPRNLQNNTTYILQQNVTLSSYLFVDSGHTSTIDLAGHTIDRGLSKKSGDNQGQVILLYGNLTLQDSVGGGKIMGGTTTFYGGGVHVADGGTFTMEGGTITGNKALWGGGVYAAAGGTVFLKGGIIKENTVDNGRGNSLCTYGNGTMKVGSDSGLSVSAGSSSWGPGDTVLSGSSWSTIDDSVITKRSVTLNANGGSPNSSTTITYGNAVGSLPTPTRSGYTFDGWYTAASGGTQVTSGSTAWGPYWVGTYYAHWTAIPAATVTTAPTAKSLTYNGNAQALVNAGAASNGTMQYRLNSGSYSTNIPTATNAGTYTVYYQAVNSSGGQNSAEGSVSVTINKADISPAVSMSGWTYGNTASSPSVSGNPGNGTVTYTYQANKTGGWTGTKPTTAGTHTVKATIAETTNYNGGTATADFTIGKRSVTVSGITASDKVYDGTTTAAFDTSGAAFDGKLAADALTVTAMGTFDNKNVGEGKTVTISGLTLGGASAGNYQLASSGQQTSTTASITRKTVTVTADAKSKTYGSADPALTYTSSGLVGTDALSGALTRAAGDTVGTYAIGQGTLSADSNYTIIYHGANLTIARKTLTVTADAQSKTYGEDDPALTYTSSGLESGDSITGALSRAEGEDAGAYAIGQGTLSAGDNYEINYTGANLTIQPKEVGLTWTDTELTYNTTPQKPTATATGLVGDDTCAVTVTGEQTDVGNYTATASALSNGNYKLPNDTTQSFTIAPKTVDAPAIELSPSSFVYDGSAKEPTVTVKDGSTTIPASEYTVSYENNVNVGRATVTITDSDDGNYVVSGGTTFSITLKPLSLTADITGWTYGGAANAPTLTGNEGNGAVTWEYTVRGADSYSETVPTDAGDYTVRASVAQTANHAAGTATKDFTIAKTALTVTAKPHTIVKGDAPDNGGVAYSGFVNDENESVLGGALAYAYDTDGNTAGVSFTITPSGLTSGNYAITYVNGTLTVKDTYAVKYHRNYAADDGEITETQRKVEDTDLTLSLPAATRTGYTLDGWFSARSGGTERTEANYTDNAALDLYAQWTANRYTVKFNANGGTGEMDDMSFTYDSAQTLTANAFTRNAYNFVGWAATSDGAVEWNDGATAQNLTAEEDGTFTLYAIWTPKPVYRVSGYVVTSDHTMLSGVVVKLIRGNEEIASAITGEDGLYVFDAPTDTYNIVAAWQKDADTEVTKTQLVVLNTNKSYELVMPNGRTSSVLELKGDDTPPVVVGGLDDEAAAVKAEAEGDETADTKKITVTMTVESKDEDEVTADATAIKTAASGKTLDYLAITIEKDVDGDKSNITTTNTVLEIVVPYNFAGKQTVEVYRYHDTNAETMTALDAQPDDENPAADGTFYLDKDNGLIYIYAQNFSTYAIGYTVPPRPVYSGGTTPTYPPNIPDTPHGELTVSPAAPKIGNKVTVTPKPDDGFEVDTVTVTGPDGKIVPVTDNGDGTYTFTQPSGKVKIEVTFKARSLEPYSDCAQDDTCPISAFSDADPKAWYHDGVHWALENGVMSGYGGAEAGKFGPNDATSRAMMAQILWNLEGKPAVNDALRYTDTDADKWYAGAIRWATAEDIMNGYGDGLFGPDDAMTREQLAAIVHRYAMYKGVDVSATSDLLGYTDQDKVSAWALPSMRWAVGSGAVLGRTDTTLDPKASATRAEIATIIKRYCTEISK